MKCGHCRRSPNLRKYSAVAKDGSAVVACICGKQWVKPAPKKRSAIGASPQSRGEVALEEHSK